ncbi:MAG: hypothetical protein AAF604_07915 [Acidobacteriota bacterium]
MKLRPALAAPLLSLLFTLPGLAEGRLPIPLPELIPIAGDWNGDGYDEIGWHRPGTSLITLCTWSLTDDPEPAPIAPLCQDQSLAAMPQPQIPLAGDWEGDGIDEPGLWNPSTGVLTRFRFENGQLERWDPLSLPTTTSRDWPFVGDWDSDGRDDLGLYTPDTAGYVLHFLDPSSDFEPIRSTYGIPGADWRPIAGTWEISGTDTDRPAFYDPLTATFHFLGSLSGELQPPVIRQIPEGPGLFPLAGAWWSGPDAIGVFDAVDRRIRLYPYAFIPTQRPLITVIVQDPDERPDLSSD